MNYKADYESWLDCDFKVLSLESIEESTCQMEMEMIKLKEDLSECIPEESLEGELSVLQKLGGKVRSVQSLLPILRLLLKEQFKDKHWIRILEQLNNGQNLVNKSFFTLQNLISGGIQKKMSEVERVYLEAVSETQMEKEIESIQSEWERTEVGFENYGEDRSRQILIGTENVLLLVDKHLEKIQNMRKFERIEEVSVPQ